MSLDGFVAGPDQSVENPLGVGGMRLHEWAFPLAVWRAMHGLQGGEVNASTRVVEESLANIGATVMGRNMFGGHPGPGIPKTSGTVGGESARRSITRCSCSRITHASRSSLKAVRSSRSSPAASRRRSNRRGEPSAVKICHWPAGRMPHISFSRPASWTRWKSSLQGAERRHNMNSVVHFEMPFDDRDRMAKFYESAFGWHTQKLGEDMGSYVLATTTETDDNGPRKPGAINGGFFPKKPGWPAQHPAIVIAVDDIKESTQKVTQAGGEVLGEPIAIPGVGQYVSFRDTEGNRVSMLEPIPRHWHAVDPAKGEVRKRPKRRAR
jgi:uncharacterized protein